MNLTNKNIGFKENFIVLLKAEHKTLEKKVFLAKDRKKKDCNLT
jgi:hypothetical protein